MHTKTLSMLGVLFLGALGFLVACQGAESNGQDTPAANDSRFTVGEPLDDENIAFIVSSDFGADTLSMEEFNGQMQNVSRYFPQAGDDSEQMAMIRASMVEQYVDRHLLLGEARKRGLEPDQLEVESHMSNIRGQFDDDETFQAALASQNMTEEDLRGQVKEQVSIESLLEHLAEGTPEPDPEAVEQFRADQATEVRAQHILFMDQGNGAQEGGDVRQLAQAVLDSIQAGADFEEMARRHSDDPGSAERGGDLGFFGRGAMVPEFEAATYALEQEGDVTPELIRTQFGYHIIRLVDKREEDPMPEEQAREMLKNERRQGYVMDEISNMRGLATVRVNPDVIDPDRLRESETMN